jgi:hypothetical protein
LRRADLPTGMDGVGFEMMKNRQAAPAPFYSALCEREDYTYNRSFPKDPPPRAKYAARYRSGR